MKQTLLATAAFVMLAAPASATAGDWYVSAGAGANWAQDTSPLTAGGDTLETEFDTGWIVAGAIGYRWLPNFRGELETAYRENDVDSVFESPNAGGPFFHTNVGGDITQFSIMANALYDIAVDGNFNLTVGAGVGAAETDFNTTLAGSPRILDADDDWSFAYQFIGGVSYAMSQNADLFVEYRYFASGDHEVVTYPLGAPRVDEVDPDNHAVSAGVRFYLSR